MPSELGDAEPSTDPTSWQALSESFFVRDPLAVAPELLGKLVVRVDPTGHVRAGRIVECEAYLGTQDPASHAFRGPTPRTRVMFGPPGHLYVYRSYGMHWCANVVCSPDGTAGAVLLRALEPCLGIEAMWMARPRAKRITDLASGPGKLCAALGITGDDDGTRVVEPHEGRGFDGDVRAAGGDEGSATVAGGVAVIDDGTPPPAKADLAVGPRIGISQATEEPWRFWDRRSRHVSRHPRPRAEPRPRADLPSTPPRTS